MFSEDIIIAAGFLFDVFVCYIFIGRVFDIVEYRRKPKGSKIWDSVLSLLKKCQVHVKYAIIKHA